MSVFPSAVPCRRSRSCPSHSGRECGDYLTRTRAELRGHCRATADKTSLSCDENSKISGRRTIPSSWSLSPLAIVSLKEQPAIELDQHKIIAHLLQKARVAELAQSKARSFTAEEHVAPRSRTFSTLLLFPSVVDAFATGRASQSPAIVVPLNSTSSKLWHTCSRRFRSRSIIDDRR